MNLSRISDDWYELREPAFTYRSYGSLMYTSPIKILIQISTKYHPYRNALSGGIKEEVLKRDLIGNYVWTRPSDYTVTIGQIYHAEQY
jgi:hypothetical protein